VLVWRRVIPFVLGTESPWEAKGLPSIRGVLDGWDEVFCAEYRQACAGSGGRHR